MILRQLPLNNIVRLLLAIAFLLFLLVPGESEPHNLSERLEPPGAEHWFGTDEFGRDLALRIAQSLRYSLLFSIQVVLLSLVIGMFMAVLIVFIPTLSVVVSLLVDILLTIPAIILALTLAASMGNGSVPMLLTLVCVISPVFTRLLRDEMRIILTEEYMLAAQLFATKLPSLLQRHIIPALIPKLLMQSIASIALATSIEASLSFLGVGLAPPAASLGILLHDARRYVFSAPWLALFPGVFLFIFLLSANYIARNR